MSSNIIRDGYTRTGYIAAVDRLHDCLQFDYRPMLPERVELIQDAAEKKPPQEAIRIVAAATCEQLVSWSEVDETKQPITISFDNVRRLPFPVLNRLYRIVAGITPSDPIPDATPQQERDYIADLLSQHGSPLLEASEKN